MTSRALSVQRAVFRWYRQHQRDLPWRHTKDPYRILVSEVMLQQTPVERVIPKYHEFLRRFPTVQACARARPRDVLLAWAGMGYNRRALYLLRAAQEVVARCGGHVPTELAALRTLPGVGHYTAAAVATFATGTPHAMADTNMSRVIGRVFRGVLGSSSRGAAATTRSHWATRRLLCPAAGGARKDGQEVAALLGLVSRTMPRRPVLGFPPALWGHALMDLGALVCRARPQCAVCPLTKWCQAYPALQQGAVHRRLRAGGPQFRVGGSKLAASPPDRLLRGRLLQIVRQADPRPVRVPTLAARVPERAPAEARRLVTALVAEGLFAWRGRGEEAVTLPT